MNSITKVSVSLVTLVSAVVAFNGCTVSAPIVSAALPQISQMTAATSQTIAQNLSAQLVAAKGLPRAERQVQVASVEISEVSDSVVVEATRLPANERLADVALTLNASL